MCLYELYDAVRSVKSPVRCGARPVQNSGQGTEVRSILADQTSGIGPVPLSNAGRRHKLKRSSCVFCILPYVFTEH